MYYIALKYPEFNVLFVNKSIKPTANFDQTLNFDTSKILIPISQTRLSL